MKVLLANDTYPPQLNGAAVTTQRLARGLAGRGHSVTVVAPSMSYRDEVQRDPSCSGVTVHRVKSFTTRPIHPDFRVVSVARIGAKLGRIFGDVEPDIVHIQNHFILGKACLKQSRKLGVPIVGTNHFMPDNVLGYIPKPLRSVSASMMWKECAKVYNRLDCVIAPSQAGLDLLLKAGLTAPVRVVSNGIDVRQYSKSPVSEDLYDKYRIRRGVPTFIVVGRLEKDKKADVVIRATVEAAESADLQTIVVGKGKDQAEFWELSRRLGADGKVVFTGYVPDEDLRGLYNLADVYAGPGVAELQGLAVMEAMASGLPILAVNAVALPELVEDGVNGYLFDATPEDLARKMLLMLESRDLRESMGRNSLDRVKSHDMPFVLREVEELYGELAAAQVETRGLRG